MQVADISADVKRIVAELACIDESEVTDGAQLSEDLQFDSLDTAELAMKLEESHFDGDFVVSDEDAAEWKTVADVIKTMEKLQAAGPRKRARR